MFSCALKEKSTDLHIKMSNLSRELHCSAAENRCTIIDGARGAWLGVWERHNVNTEGWVYEASKHTVRTHFGRRRDPGREVNLCYIILRSADEFSKIPTFMKPFYIGAYPFKCLND